MASSSTFATSDSRLPRRAWFERVTPRCSSTERERGRRRAGSGARRRGFVSSIREAARSLGLRGRSATRGRDARVVANALATRSGDVKMVLYDFLMIVKSSVPKNQLGDILRRTGTRVLDAGGVITDVTSYGTRTLACEFKAPGEALRGAHRADELQLRAYRVGKPEATCARTSACCGGSRSRTEP